MLLPYDSLEGCVGWWTASALCSDTRSTCHGCLWAATKSHLSLWEGEGDEIQGSY